MELVKQAYTWIYNTCGGNEELIGTWVFYVYALLVFWGCNVPLSIVDLTGKPEWVKKFKVQHGKNEPVDLGMFKQVLKTVAFNMIVLNLVFMYPAYGLQKRRGMSFKPEEVPSLSRFIVELVVFVLIQEVIFYYSHRLFHHPFLYKRVHKLHHTWTAPIGLVSIYATPAEYLIGNSTSVFLGPVIMGSHITSAWLWYAIGIFFTTIHHSGYHLPFFPSPQFHDYHHLRFPLIYFMASMAILVTFILTYSSDAY